MTGTPREALGLKTALMYLVPVSLVIIAFDQLTKIWAQNTLSEGGPAQPFIGDFISFRLIYNPGAALSMASGMTWILTIVSTAVVVYIFYIARKVSSKLWVVTLALLLGGAIGNLIDRLFRAPGFPNGHVVDFIDYGPFVGNVADIAIVTAAILIALLALIGIPPFEQQHDEDDAPQVADQ
ncbi:signal peptidase II [Timonella sp. A28]|uniref:signal peptidase II n=1 Tax=Timonella sp. A28 TaxID=3442640 RepID=UPI003EBEBA54